MKQNSSRFGVERMCKTLGLSRSGYYAYKSKQKGKRELERAELLKEISIVFQESRELYGSPRITAALLSKGIRHALVHESSRPGRTRFPAFAR